MAEFPPVVLAPAARLPACWPPGKFKKFCNWDWLAWPPGRTPPVERLPVPGRFVRPPGLAVRDVRLAGRAVLRVLDLEVLDLEVLDLEVLGRDW